MVVTSAKQVRIARDGATTTTTTTTNTTTTTTTNDQQNKHELQGMERLSARTISTAGLRPIPSSFLTASSSKFL